MCETGGGGGYSTGFISEQVRKAIGPEPTSVLCYPSVSRELIIEGGDSAKRREGGRGLGVGANPEEGGSDVRLDKEKWRRNAVFSPTAVCTHRHTQATVVAYMWVCVHHFV